ncbi:MAG: rod shape-determining protein RodA [Candidatus Omnitrophica bacterium]|nr:rod shape-determining protein RodA [Candidatus Omnitrophota bacterium]
MIRLGRFDYTLVLIILAIFIIGIGALYSATYQNSTQLFDGATGRQIVWMGLGFAAFFLIANVPYHRLLSGAWLFYFICLIFLGLVLVMGHTRGGATRWIQIGSFSLQPSEFTKIGLILLLSSYLSNNRVELRRIRPIMGVFLLMLIPFALILIEPDLGTAVVLIPIAFAMLYAAGANARYLLYIFIAGVATSPIFWSLLKDYQKQRLMVFINPNIDPLGAGYTIIQSKIAIGSGGLLGKGWLSGTQNQLNFLPERHTDFIFSVIGEEWGFLGGAILLFLYLLLIWRILRIATGTQDLYGQLLCVGVATMISFQIIVNIAMTIGLMPVVGMPLPLISYGGSSLLNTMIGMGILMSVSARR